MRNYLRQLVEPKSNASQAAKLLVKLMNVKISQSSLNKEIHGHPDYPSLLSLSDVLNSYGVENRGVKFDLEKISQIPTPFIVQFNESTNPINSFTVVDSTTDNSIHFFDPEEERWRSESKKEFLKKCSGVALLAQSGENAGEKDYERKIRQENSKRIIRYLTFFCIPVIIVIMGVIALVENGGGALLPFIFSISTLSGCIIAALVIWYELDQHNPLFEQICNVGKKINCGAILQSKAAKIAGISWSVIGLSYFWGVLLLMLFFGMTAHRTMFIVSWISILAIPFTFFSIYYQWRIANHWCLLCLSIQAVLLSQFLMASIGNRHILNNFYLIDLTTILQTLTAFVIPFLIGNNLLPILEKAKEDHLSHIELRRIKHNPEIFEAVLKTQKVVTESVDDLGIFLGNPNGAYKLIKVCNPFCGPCAKAHKPMEDLLHNNPNVQMRILFNASNNEFDVKAPPVRHLLAIAEKNEEVIIKQALDDWYSAEKKDYQLFAAKYPMNGELNKQDAKIEAMRNWCNNEKIEFTPTFFVSLPDNKNKGSEKYYQLPKMYSVTDLKYFLAI